MSSMPCLSAQALQVSEWSLMWGQTTVTWTRLTQLQQENVAVKAKGLSANPNGAIVNVMGISGFLPKRFMDRVSHVDVTSTHASCRQVTSCCQHSHGQQGISKLHAEDHTTEIT